jgi:hypothetical protein
MELSINTVDNSDNTVFNQYNPYEKKFEQSKPYKQKYFNQYTLNYI